MNITNIIVVGLASGLVTIGVAYFILKKFTKIYFVVEDSKTLPCFSHKGRPK